MLIVQELLFNLNYYLLLYYYLYLYFLDGSGKRKSKSIATGTGRRKEGGEKLILIRQFAFCKKGKQIPFKYTKHPLLFCKLKGTIYTS